MRSLISAIFLLTFLGSAARSQTTPAYGVREKNQDIRAFVNARIVLSPEQTIDSGILVIRNGLVEAVGKNVQAPPEALIADLAGFTLYPGFIEPFCEYGLSSLPRERKKSDSLQFSGQRVGGNAANDAVHPEVDWVKFFKPDEKEYKELLACGFTSVQSCKLDGIFRGRAFITHLGNGLPNELVIKPYSHPFCAFDKGTSQQENPSSLMGSISLIRQTFYDVDWYENARAAFAANSKQKPPEFNTALDALHDYRTQTYFFETDDELSLLRADRIAREFQLSFVHIGSNYEYARLAEIMETGSPVILPLNFPPPPEVKTIEDELDVKLSDLRHWETAPFNASILEKNGNPFAFTSYRLKKKEEFLKNLRKTVKHGLSKATALKAVTTVPAQLLGIENLAGTIEVGKQADFLVTDGDIFDDSTTLYSAWVKGKEHQINARPAADYRGEYMLRFEANQWPLSLKGRLSKFKGTVSTPSDTIKLADIRTDLGNIYFNVSLKVADSQTVFRFTGAAVENGLVGKVAAPDGRTLDWSASKTGAFTPEKDTSIAKTPQRIASLTSPNKAFGLSSLPEVENVLLKNATVWTSEAAGILTETDVLVQKGKIAAIGKSLPTTTAVKVIDCSGKHVTAGVIDEHSHIAASGNINECTDVITAEVRIGDVINPYDIDIYRQLAGGVTTVQVLHGSCNAIGGQAQIIKLRWGHSSEEMKFAGAPPTIKCALGENVKRSGWGEQFNTRYPLTRMGVETVMRDAFQTAREYGDAWSKYNSLSSREKSRTVPPRRDLELDAVLEVINSQRFIHCHSYVQTEILMLMRLAEQYGFKVQNFTHILEGYKVADEMAAHGATASSFSDWWAYKFEVYDAIPYNVALMTEKGVISSVNSDNADLARRLNQESAKAVQYGGMSQEEAIKLCTINSAIQLKVDDKIGSIKVGKDADFVIWSTNPLSIYARAEQTWIEGRKFFDLDTDQLMRRQIADEKKALVQKVLTSSETKSRFREGLKREDERWHCDDCFDYWQEVSHAE